jgi:hypothetical protein
MPLLVALLLLAPAPALARDLPADPATLGTVLDGLLPGDVVHLAAGDYTDPVYLDLANGTAAEPIVIEGPASGVARFVGDPRICCNIFEIRDSSFVVLRRLTFDGAGLDGVFGISAGGGDPSGDGRNVVHDVTVEDCRFVGFGGSMNHDAISTKTPTWGWVVRRNVFESPGIGIYFGNSTGEDPFIGGRIEHNLFVDCLGYCMQIKWQLPRPTDWPGMPTGPSVTVIADNVFVHGDRVDASPRPNLLVGGFAMTGPGSEDRYEIARNFFADNPNEPLLQASGRVSIHDNVFVDGPPSGNPALLLRDHDLPIRQAWVYGNTIYTSGTAVSVGAGDQGTALVGNAIFAGTPVSGTFDDDRSNVLGALADADAVLVSPALALPGLDLHPTGLAGTPDVSMFAADSLHGLDFECRPRTPAFVGAYEGPADAESWALAAALKPDLCGAVPGTDAGSADAGVPADAPGRDAPGTDAPGTDAGPSGGGADCGCSAARARRPGMVGLGLLVALVVAPRRRRVCSGR